MCSKLISRLFDEFSLKDQRTKIFQLNVSIILWGDAGNCNLQNLI